MELPTQKAKLMINFNKKQETFDIIMNEVWEKLQLNNKELRKQFVLSDTFVNDVAKLYWTESKMEEHTLRDMTTDDKYIILWETMKEYKSSTENRDYIMNKQLKSYILLSTLLIIFTNLLVLFFKF